jgi:hypothetical protein
MTKITLPRLELIEPKDTSLKKSDKKNNFIIFRNEIHGKKIKNKSLITFQKTNSKKSKKYKINKKNKTKKHNKNKSFFNIF